jgi:ubiquitin C-terminal hydrolase
MVDIESLNKLKQITEENEINNGDNSVLAGIHSFGWNCYLNSILQALSSDILLIEGLLKYNDEDKKMIELIIKYNLKFSDDNSDTKLKIKKILETNKNPDTDNDILFEEKPLLEFLFKNYNNVFICINMKDLLVKMYSERNKTMDLSNFISVNRIANQNNIWSNLFIGQQNDPHELLSYLQNLIQETKYKSIQIDFNAIYPTDDSRESKIKRTYIDDFKSRFKNKYSIINNIYDYYTLSIIKCSKCEHEIFNTSPYSNLSLPIPNDNSISIFDCLNLLSRPERLDDYKCENCNNRDGNYLEKQMITTPKILILHLKRFESNMFGNLCKKNNKVDYPMTLNLNNYCIGNINNTSGHNFMLFSVICHSGNLSSGHYISYTRRLFKDSNDNYQYTPWYKCNDETVTKVDESEVINHNLAYILFYHKI